MYLNYAHIGLSWSLKEPIVKNQKTEETFQAYFP